MIKSINLQHRHFVLIAETIAKCELSDAQRQDIARTFARELAATNPRFCEQRFIACAMGNPSSGRDA